MVVVLLLLVQLLSVISREFLEEENAPPLCHLAPSGARYDWVRLVDKFEQPETLIHILKFYTSYKR